MSITLGAAKIIFYSYLCLHHHENVEIVTNSPTRCETVIDTKKLNLPANSSYYNIMKKGNGYDVIFRNKMFWYGGSTCLYNTEEKLIHSIMQEKYHLNHNFCVFPSKCGTKYYGIGGQHSPVPLKGGRKKKIEPMISYRDMMIVSPDIQSEYHQNGLYLMQSTDKIHWEYVKTVPVISGIHPGHTDGHFGYSLFDSKICCFYSKILQQYVLFIRANMRKGCRWIQTTRSKDLIHWEPFRLLKMEDAPGLECNFYHLDVMEYPDVGAFIGLSPYANRDRHPTEVCIKLMFSRNGIQWIDRGSILDTPVCASECRNSTHTTSVFFDRGDHYDMFFNENYNGVLYPKRSATVVRYTIPKDRLVGVRSHGVGTFSFDMKVRSDHMVLNYACHDGGYLKLTIKGKEFVVHGDALNKVITLDSSYIGQDIRVNVEMKDTVLYSCAS